MTILQRAKRRATKSVVSHRRLATLLGLTAFMGAVFAVTAPSVAAGSPDHLAQAQMHWNSLERYNDEPQYLSHASCDAGNCGSANDGPYYFAVHYGQQLDFSIWQQEGDCPCFHYWEWNRTYGYALIPQAKGGGDCGCAPFDMNKPSVGTVEWEWYHHRRNQTYRAAQNTDGQGWTGPSWCCASSTTEEYHGEYTEQDDYYDPLVHAQYFNGGNDSYPEIMIDTPDYYGDFGY